MCWEFQDVLKKIWLYGDTAKYKKIKLLDEEFYN